jgi:hypothetical protein
MKIVELKLYEFNELSDNAKEKARNWYKEGNNYDFLDEFITDFVTERLQEIGFFVDDLVVSYDLGYSQGDGASFTAKLTKGLESYEVNRSDSRYSHYMTICEVYHEDADGNIIDEPELLETMRQIAKDAEKAGYEYIEAEDSDESVDENITANEYTFEADGTRRNA